MPVELVKVETGVELQLAILSGKELVLLRW